jgi:hypothetical protein
LFLIFEAAKIYLFPRDEKVIPRLKRRGGVREGKEKEILDLGREGTLKEEVGNGFEG